MFFEEGHRRELRTEVQAEEGGKDAGLKDDRGRVGTTLGTGSGWFCFSGTSLLRATGVSSPPIGPSRGATSLETGRAGPPSVPKPSSNLSRSSGGEGVSCRWWAPSPAPVPGRAALRRLAGGESAAGPEAPLSSRPRGAIGGPGRASPPLPLPRGAAWRGSWRGLEGAEQGLRSRACPLSFSVLSWSLASTLGWRWARGGGCPLLGGVIGRACSLWASERGSWAQPPLPLLPPGRGSSAPIPPPSVPAPPAPASILPGGLRPPRLEGVGVGPPSATLGKSPKVSGEKKVGPPKDRWRGQLRGVDRLLPAGLVLPACAPDPGSPPASRLRSPRAGPSPSLARLLSFLTAPETAVPAPVPGACSAPCSESRDIPQPSREWRPPEPSSLLRLCRRLLVLSLNPMSNIQETTQNKCEA